MKLIRVSSPLIKITQIDYCSLVPLVDFKKESRIKFNFRSIIMDAASKSPILSPKDKAILTGNQAILRAL